MPHGSDPVLPLGGRRPVSEIFPCASFVAWRDNVDAEVTGVETATAPINENTERARKTKDDFVIGLFPLTLQALLPEREMP